jgi:UDP-GlcNAc3NAcA epimerase
MKIITVIGARPQFIKASALSREFRKHPEIEEILVHTGQHFDTNMSGIFFSEMNIPEPKYNLDIHSLSHGAMTGLMLSEIEKVLLLEKPDYVLVYGDTNSTLAGALAAQKLHIKVIHVEAGLRSFNMQMPEEVNRILTDRISSLLFCPTQQAIDNLYTEGYKNFDCSIFLSGDVMQDNAIYYAGIAATKSGILQELNLEPEKYLLCTIHRAENTDNPDNLNQIISALNTLGKDFGVVVPLHPRTRKILETGGQKLNFRTIDPVGYLDMINLISLSKLVLTDSGGLQKEAYFFDKFCVTMREQTEWTELVENGVNILTGADSEKIIKAVRELSGLAFPRIPELYGNGEASASICRSILEHYSGNRLS